MRSPSASRPLFAHWVRPAASEEGQPAPSGLQDKPLLILLHGYGSNELDLAGLRPYLPSGLNMVSLRAPIMMQPESYTWFPIGEPGNPDPENVATAVTRVLDWIEQHILPQTPSSVGLLGFSMGGAMTIQLMRTRPELFAYGLNLSGFSVGGTLDSDAQLAGKQLPLFWGYDLADPVIASHAIERSAEFLPKHFNVTEQQYPGIGHSISREELEDIGEFLTKHAGL